MPELPEVETVVRDLRPLVAGRIFTAVRRSKQKLRRPWDPAWAAALTGAKVAGVRRRGKWILVDLIGRESDPPPGPLPAGRGWRASSVTGREPDSRRGSEELPLPAGRGPGGGSPRAPLLRVHLGMTGQFTVAPPGTPEPDHLHLALALDDGAELRLRDPRRFGSAELFADRAAVEAEMDAELGPEPFGLDPEYFRATVRGTGRNLKAILLDQKVVAGVGNIYADEACFRAGLHPGRAGKRLTRAECDRLRDAVEAVLTRAVEARGSTIRDYVGGSGLKGGFQLEHAVYGRTDEPCLTCETPIALARYAGRASHYCPVCQQRSPRREKQVSHR